MPNFVIGNNMITYSVTVTKKENTIIPRGDRTIKQILPFIPSFSIQLNTCQAVLSAIQEPITSPDICEGIERRPRNEIRQAFSRITSIPEGNLQPHIRVLSRQFPPFYSSVERRRTSVYGRISKGPRPFMLYDTARSEIGTSAGT